MEIDVLRQNLNAISSYPPSLKKVGCEIPGLGFFPGARGLWDTNDNMISNKPIMMLGHDFGAEKDYILSVKRGCENIAGLKWNNLLLLLKKYELNPQDIFFTNAI
jgi:hypothetical protein